MGGAGGLQKPSRARASSVTSVNERDKAAALPQKGSGQNRRVVASAAPGAGRSAASVVGHEPRGVCAASASLAPCFFELLMSRALMPFDSNRLTLIQSTRLESNPVRELVGPWHHTGPLRSPRAAGGRPRHVASRSLQQGDFPPGRKVALPWPPNSLSQHASLERVGASGPV